MSINQETYLELRSSLAEKQVTLVAVSKTKPAEDIMALYELGQRDFGENYVQELAEKAAQLPTDIRWHFIGHLQSNKVKYIAPFVHLIHAVDSFKLLEEINKQGNRHGRTIDCLLQVFIAREESKFGLDEDELADVVSRYNEAKMEHVRVRGLMGMASFTDNMDTVRDEFRKLKSLFDRSRPAIASLDILSMGMSGDYNLAIEEGSTMVRVGSLLFGPRATV